MYIIPSTTYSGREGMYLGGHVYEVTKSKLRAIAADLKNQKLPKFEYEETVAPHLQNADPDTLALETARKQLGTAQGELTRCRDRQEGLTNHKQKVEAEIAEFDKLSKEDLKKPPIKQFSIIAKAKLQIDDAMLELAETDIAEHTDAADKLDKLIERLQTKIKAKVKRQAKAERKRDRNNK